MSNRDIDSTSENVLHDWAREPAAPEPEDAVEAESDESADVSSEDAAVWGTATQAEEAEHSVAVELGDEVEPADVDEPDEADAEIVEEALVVELSHEHAAGDLHIPDGYAVLEGVSEGGRRAVGVVVSRFNGSVTTQLLDGALSELAGAGVRQEAITIMVVPGAFELPLAATALAKTRRFACIVALGCVIRGDTPHFDYVASEAASGLQLAALETGVPVSFGVLTLDRVDQAEARVGKGAEAVRSALEMADLFAHLRAAAAAH
ncbi:MAG TPA: 6,7-dimethyl-8-ribityllumazine synthase [Gaiellaceae bacterium]|nr:6,7-dimethyl-8-ribityllumazine synthase [Gaiellaceae bacterium]